MQEARWCRRSRLSLCGKIPQTREIENRETRWKIAQWRFEPSSDTAEPRIGHHLRQGSGQGSSQGRVITLMFARNLVPGRVKIETSTSTIRGHKAPWQKIWKLMLCGTLRKSAGILVSGELFPVVWWRLTSAGSAGTMRDSNGPHPLLINQRPQFSSFQSVLAVFFIIIISIYFLPRMPKNLTCATPWCETRLWSHSNWLFETFGFLPPPLTTFSPLPRAGRWCCRWLDSFNVTPQNCHRSSPRTNTRKCG